MGSESNDVSVAVRASFRGVLCSRSVSASESSSSMSATALGRCVGSDWSSDASPSSLKLLEPLSAMSSKPLGACSMGSDSVSTVVGAAMVDSIAAATAVGSSAAAVGTWAGAGWSGGEVAEAGSGNSIVGVGIAPVRGC